MKSVKVPTLRSSWLGAGFMWRVSLFVQKQLDFPCPLLSKVLETQETLGVNSFFPSLTSSFVPEKLSLI